MTSKAQILISRSKASLIIDNPFFATLLLGMEWIETKEVPTMATDGERILFNPEFTESLTANEITFVLAHETLHCVFDHMGRRESRDPMKWNIAADYCINEILVNDRIGSMPKGCLLDPKLTAKAGHTAEGVYKLLPDSPKGKDKGKGAGKGDGKGGYPGPGEPGGPLDDVLDAGKDPAERARKSSDLKGRIIQATNAAKAAGKLSAGMARLVEDAIKPRVDWKSELRRFMTEKVKESYSWAKPKRRFLAQDLYLPSLSGEGMGKIIIGVDCSGSVDDETLAIFAAEIKAICEDSKPSAVEVIYFDSKICGSESYTRDDLCDLDLTPHGGGGTDFAPVLSHAAYVEPCCLIMLTDLEGPFGSVEPACPILWAVIGRNTGTPPYGDVLKVDTND